MGVRSEELGDVANDFYLTKDNQADFEYALMESIGGGKYSSTYGYKTIDGVRVRVKGHTPNWDNFVDWDTGEPVSDKILNVTVGDYDNSDYRRNKASLDEFIKEYPGVKVVDVEIADGTYLGEALAKIEGALKDKGISMEFNPSYTWAEKYTKENNNLGDEGLRFRGETTWIKAKYGLRGAGVTTEIETAEDMELLKGRLEKDDYNKLKESFNNPRTYGASIPAIRGVFVYTKKSPHPVATWWHENTHVIYRELELADKKECGLEALEWLHKQGGRGKEHYDFVVENYDKELWDDEASSRLVQYLIEQYAERFLSSNFDGNDKIAKLANAIRNKFIYGTEEPTERDILRRSRIYGAYGDRAYESEGTRGIHQAIRNTPGNTTGRDNGIVSNANSSLGGESAVRGDEGTYSERKGVIGSVVEGTPIRGMETGLGGRNDVSSESTRGASEKAEGGVRYRDESGGKKEKHSKEDSQDLTTIIVSSKNANAKIVRKKQVAKENLAGIATKYKNGQKTRGFLGDLKRALGETKTEGQSSYFDFNTPNSEITLRISNHNAKGENFDGDREAISVVIKSERTKNTFEEGENLTEFVYFKERIAKADGKTLSQIAESIKDLLDTGVYVDKSGLAVVNPEDSEHTKVKRADEESDVSDAGTRFSIVTDEELIKRLDSDEKVIGYRNVVLNEDGTFGSPMANSLRSTDRKSKEKTSGFEMNKWEMSEERPHRVDENGKITLVKPDGKAVEKVDYNPYIHNRLNRVNKQFKQAWERPNLVYIKTEIPLSDLESGYHADKAKLPVGEHKWNGGNLILSRYDKPVEICDWKDVADDWEAEFGKKGIHFDIIPPALLPILEARGMNIIAPHKGMGAECNAAYKEWKAGKAGEGVRFRFSETEEEFRATQKEAVEKKGIVTPNLATAVVDVVEVPRHNFKGSLKEARAEAKEWAKENYVGKEFSMPDNGGVYIISNNAIDKYLDKTSVGNSDNASVHLSALTKIPEIISNSITGEIHADYKKGDDGERRVENGIGNSNLLVHRLYGAINLDNKVYRVKTTMREFLDTNKENTPHSYEVIKIEPIEDRSATRQIGDHRHLNRSNSSIDGAKLLKDVEKSYDKGKYLLEESEKAEGVRFRFIGEKGAEALDKSERESIRFSVSEESGGKKISPSMKARTNLVLTLPQAILFKVRTVVLQPPQASPLTM